MNIYVRLPEFLARHRVKPIAIVQAANGEASQGAIYALTRGDAKRVDLNTLAVVMDALERVTGKPVTFEDVLERREPQQDPEKDPALWLATGVRTLEQVEPYDWAEDEANEGTPLNFEEGKGWGVGV